MPDTASVLTLVINLDRSPHRLSHIQEQLGPLDWPWQRLPAADGRTLDMTDPALIDVAAFERRHGKTPLPGELGCYLSHVRALQAFLATEHRHLLVLEDDVRIGADMPAVVTALLAQAAAWDVVMLSGIHRATPLSLQPVWGPYRLAVALTRYAGASCYLVNRNAAQALVRDLLPMSLPYDYEYDLAWKRGLRTRIVVPAPCQHSYALASDLLPAGMVNLNFHWSRRLSTYAWRLRVDLRRIAHGLWQWWRYRTPQGR